MDQETKISVLKKEFDYWDSTARAYVEFDGLCVYCNMDLVGDSRKYALGVIDHLLPESKYKNLRNQPQNWILSCAGCNYVKGDFDCLKPGEDAQDMLLNHRNELLQRVKDWFEKLYAENEKERKKVAEIIRE